MSEWKGRWDVINPLISDMRNVKRIGEKTC